MRELIVISNHYPFYIGEDWMYKELKEASKYFDKIYLFPLVKKDSQVRWIPENCELLESFIDIRTQSFKFNYTLNFKTITHELLKSSKRIFILRNIKLLLHTSFLSQIKSEILIKELTRLKCQNPYFYSVWMGEGSLALSFLKQKKLIDNFVFRLHGYDLFDERRPGNYMPFRNFNFKHADKIFVLSETGKNYLLKKNLYPEKIITNYSGLYDHGFGPFDPDGIFTIVSCSSMFNFKRVKMIAEIIQELNFQCIWHHFGDGKEYEEVKRITSNYSKEIKVYLHGRISNAEIINFYQTNHVNLFIHLSTTEGLGMAIVEAQSFGIPALAINAGGVNEVVNEQTGILLPLDSNQKEILKAIENFKQSNLNSIEYRKKVKMHFNLKFNAYKNYHFFFNEIIKLKPYELK